MINQERKRDSSLSTVIKTFALNQPTTDSTVVEKRVTNRQTDKIFLYSPADSILSVSKKRLSYL
jgi:hypothetical protein